MSIWQTAYTLGNVISIHCSIVRYIYDRRSASRMFARRHCATWHRWIPRNREKVSDL